MSPEDAESLQYNTGMWRLVTRLRPLGWLGLVVAVAGTQVVEVGARRSDWGLVAIGAVLLSAGAVVMLRGRRAPEE